MVEEQALPQSKTPKIRSSCDSCQHYKIRCGKERPACRRCMKYGIDCIYSPSRRAGRPRPRKTGADSAAPAVQQPQPLSSTSVAPSPQQRQQQQQDDEEQQQQQQQQTAFSTLITGSSRQDQSNRESPLGEETIVVAVTHPGATTPAEPTASLTPDLAQFLERSPAPSGTAHGAGRSPRCHNEPFPDLTDLGAAEGFPAMFCDFSNTHTPDMRHDSASGMDFLFSPLDGIDFPKTPALDCSSASSDGSARSTAPSTTKMDVRTDVDVDVSWPPEPPGCNCSVALLEQLAQSTHLRRGHCGGEQLASIASALSQSRPLLNRCCSVLSCAQCAPRFSSVLMVCEAMDRVSVALDVGPLWDEAGSGGGGGGGVDGAAGAGQAVRAVDLARDQSPLRCGSYLVRGGDRRVVLRVLVLKHLTELQSIMSRLQATTESPPISDSPLRKICSDLVSHSAVKLSLNISMVKVLL